MTYCKRRLCILLIITMVVISGCSVQPTPSPTEKAVRATISKYNRILATGYRSMNMSGLQEVATRAQAETEYVHMSSLAEGGVTLDATLRELRFGRVSVESTSARVETWETWDYRQYGRADGRLVLEQRGLDYHLTWDLALQADGRWLVSDVRAISSTATVEPNVVGSITPVPSQNP